MKVGDRVVRCPVTVCGYDEHCKQTVKKMPGTVVFIHPDGRFHSVSFETPGGKIIESFPGTEMLFKTDDVETMGYRRSKYAR